jgi:GH25 family lysozyme M1 (1,4-beta-N-acetylmuramidase)
VDITEYQHPNGAAVDWSKIHQSGIKFATLKATRGTNIINSYFAGDLAAALAQGIPTAPYHFLTGTSANLSQQADYFIAELRSAGYTGHGAYELPPILDLEWTDDGTSSCPPYDTVSAVQGWLDKVRAAFGVKPMIYTARGFMTSCMGSTTAFGSYLLQVADYTSGHTNPAIPPGWPSWLMWQYADVGSVPGVPTGNVTLDVFNGSQDLLDSLANVAPPIIGVVGSNGDVVAKYGLGDYWTPEIGGIKQVAVAGTRIAVLGNDGRVQVKSGLTGSWKPVFDGAAQVVLSNQYLGVLDTAGNAWAKAGTDDTWTPEIGGVTQIAFGGDRIAVLDNAGNVKAKQGLNGTWTPEYGGASQVAMSPTRIGVIASDGTAYVKDGMNDQWTPEYGGAIQLALS